MLVMKAAGWSLAKDPAQSITATLKAHRDRQCERRQRERRRMMLSWCFVIRTSYRTRAHTHRD